MPPRPRSRALFAAAWRVPGVRRLRLGGVAPDLPERAGGVSGVTVLRPLFWIDLERTRQAGDPLAHLSANSRSQMRRALRAFGGEAARLEPAPGPKALDAFIAAHQAWWQARGKPGAFARPFMRRFHADLLARGEASGEVALRVLRAPDGRAAAWLHLLRRGGHVAAYQSAVACDADLLRLKPGLVAHLLAIAEAAAEGRARYDLLAGEARYKRSLATDEASLVWTERLRPGSLDHLADRLVRFGRRVLGR
ncbi:MAG: GNAT family N-acetyltransferase [Acetobacteraceae bacterium]|nr:GNAT family N-acetyltransferase [Acetobacteraceae bacterium]